MMLEQFTNVASEYKCICFCKLSKSEAVKFSAAIYQSPLSDTSFCLFSLNF